MALTERSPSQTALGAASLRAAHQLLDGEPKIVEDPIVLKLIHPTVLEWIRRHPDYYQVPRRRSLRTHMMVRSRFAEDRLEQAASAGVSQYVILGAGIDTFAYRQPAWAAGLKIFEVDHPASQAAKQELLNDAGIPQPANLEYVLIDFETDDLLTGLSRGPIRLDQPVFFSLLGVIVYLTGEAIAALFQSIASLPPQTEIVFSFSSRNPNSGQPHRATTTETQAASGGEPWITFFQPDALEQNLHADGFSEVFFLTPEETNRRYLQGRSDGLSASPRISIASARV